MEVWLEVLKAFITAGLALLGVIIANNKASGETKTLILYRLEELEKKVDIHNSAIDRLYRLEGETDVQANDIKTLYHKVEKLEAKV